MNAIASETKNVILPAQVRGARGLLGWTLDQLIAASGVTKSTLIRFENATVTPRASTIEAIRAALEAAGVIFIQQNGDGPGVRLRKDGEA